MMKKISSIISISRPVNFIIASASIFVAGLICSGDNVLFLKIISASVSGALIGAAGNIVNDIFDLEIDKINRPQRVLPAGSLTINQAWITYYFFSIFALALAALINTASFFIAVLSSFVIFFYSYRIKKIPLFGNITVAFFTGLAFIFGGIAAGNWRGGIVPAVFAFIINLIREIVKDIEDLDGDLANNIVTFPAKYGIEKTKKVIIALTFALIAVTTIPFWMEIYSIEYFIMVMMSVNILLIYFVKEIRKPDPEFHKLSGILKLNMILGLLAIYAGAKL